MSSVIVAKPSVILAFKFVISGTGVENTLSLTYPYKRSPTYFDITLSSSGRVPGAFGEMLN
jgi:hypothetical protein